MHSKNNRNRRQHHHTKVGVYRAPIEDLLEEQDFNQKEVKSDFKQQQQQQDLIWSDPLPTCSWSVPVGKYNPGGFGSKRKHSIYTGIDLYAPKGTPVYAAENGLVVEIEFFTGPKAESPWYNETKAILVEGKSGVLLYGEIEPLPDIEPGVDVKAGDLLGHIVSVLKEDKGNGVSMLHFEMYTRGTRRSLWWHHGREKPRNLLDPTQHLLSLKTDRKSL